MNSYMLLPTVLKKEDLDSTKKAWYTKSYNNL